MDRASILHRPSRILEQLRHSRRHPALPPDPHQHPLIPLHQKPRPVHRHRPLSLRQRPNISKREDHRL